MWQIYCGRHPPYRRSFPSQVVSWTTNLPRVRTLQHDSSCHHLSPAPPPLPPVGFQRRGWDVGPITSIRAVACNCHYPLSHTQGEGDRQQYSLPGVSNCLHHISHYSPAAFQMFFHYMACVAVPSWGKLVFKMCGGAKHLVFSWWPAIHHHPWFTQASMSMVFFIYFFLDLIHIL